MLSSSLISSKRLHGLGLTAWHRFVSTSTGRSTKAARGPSTRVSRSVITPSNESKLHYKTKEHLANQLALTNSLSVRKTCSTVSDPEAPSLLPYWTCTNSIVESNWLQGWTDAKMEYSKRGVGRFDLALLRNDASKESSLVGVVEVLVTSPMTDSKVSQLQNRKIPWLEVQAEVDFFRDEAKLLSPKQSPLGSALDPIRAWTKAQPLPVIGTSDGPWKCDVCKEMALLKPDSIVFSHIMAIVDVYCSAPTPEGRGQLRRKVFGIYEQTRPKVWSDPEQKEEKHWFLVVGTSLSTTKWLGMNTLPMESKLLLSTHSLNTPPTSPPMELFRQEIEKELQRARRKDAGALLDVRLEWPGASLADFFTKTDSMASLVSIQGIKTIGQLQASLTRLVGFRYRFHPEEGVWIPSRNHRK